MKEIYLFAERDCHDDSRERVALAFDEFGANGAKEARKAIEQAVDDGSLYPGSVMGPRLDGNQWLLISGHAISRGRERKITRTELTERLKKFFENDDAVFDITDNCLEVCTKGCFSVTSETGKHSTFVEFEDDNVALIIEAYQYGYRLASCWNFREEKRKYILDKTNDYLFVGKDGTVSRTLSERVAYSA